MALFKKTPDGHDEDYQMLLSRSIEELKIKTSAHDSLFNLGTAAWSADLEKGVIEFASPDGMKATCSLQVIGTLNTQDGTWLWSWGNASIPSNLQAHAKMVREYGKKNRIQQLTMRKSPCSEETAWEFAAIACKLGNAQGAYRGQAGTTNVFMTYYDVKVTK